MRLIYWVPFYFVFSFRGFGWDGGSKRIALEFTIHILPEMAGRICSNYQSVKPSSLIL